MRAPYAHAGFELVETLGRVTAKLLQTCCFLETPDKDSGSPTSLGPETKRKHYVGVYEVDSPNQRLAGSMTSVVSWGKS